MSQNLNVELVRHRAREIRENLGKIQIYVAQTDDEFFADERNLYTVMHLLLICIEAVGSICNHLLAKTAYKAPASYAECFEGLRDLNILDESLQNRLVQMARFRNILVHRYWQVDSGQVLRYARENLDDFDHYLYQIGQFVSRQL